MSVTVDTLGSEVEVTVWSSSSTGLSVVLSPEAWAALVEKGEAQVPVREWRRQQSMAAAREAQSYGAARASRK